MDGKVVIGTALDTKQLEKDIKNAEKELKSFQKEEERLNKEKGKVELNLQTYEEEKAKIKENNRLLKEQATTKEQMKNLTSLQNQEIEALNTKYSKQMSSMDNIANKLEKNKLNQGLINSKIQEMNNKLNQSKGLDKIKKDLGKVNKGLTNTVKKVARWGLAIFGVRSAYNAVRRASSTLAQYNEQYAKNLEYIHYALANMLAPVLQFLVNLAFKLLSYINYIANAWFGINLFANASAKSMNKMAGSAKQIRKELQQAGFDEMNVLSDTSSGGAGGAGAVMPEFDLSQMQGEVPEWIKWIAEHKDEILSVMAGVATGLIAWKLHLGGIKSLGIGTMLSGILLSITALMKYINDPTWGNFGKVITGIGIAILGLGVIIGNVPVAIAGVAVAILGIIVSNWEKIRGFFQSGIDWLKDKSDWVHNMFGDTLGNIYDMLVQNLQSTLNMFNSTFTAIKGILDGIIMFVKGVFTGNWQMAWEGIKTIFSNVLNGIKGIFLNVFGIIKNMVIDIAQRTGQTINGVFKAVVNSVMWTIEKTLNTPIRAVNKLVGVINKVPGINLGYLPTFNLPRLKVGGIINMPGRGVPIGGGMAIGGEAGREGVIPLTDSQAMAELGEAIGRYVNISANIPVYVGNRQIAREIKRINAEDDFAFNN